MTSNQRIDRRAFLAASGLAGIAVIGASGCGSGGSVVKKKRVPGEADGAFGQADRGSGGLRDRWYQGRYHRYQRQPAQTALQSAFRRCRRPVRGSDRVTC